MYIIGWIDKIDRVVFENEKYVFFYISMISALRKLIKI